VDIAVFPTVAGDSTEPVTFYHKCAGDYSSTGFATFDALAANNARDYLGDTFRAYWTVTDAGTDNAEFTFSVAALPIY
jgi:hypothetical protein